MLGEASTTEITVQKDAQGFQENKEAALQVEKLQVMQEKSLKLKVEEKL